MNLIEATDAGFRAAAPAGAFKGAVKNLGNQEYHGLASYWSSTQLKYLHSTSPAHFKAKYIDKIMEPEKLTDKMILGSLVHCLILTPDEFAKEFFVMPALNLRTNDGKAEKEKLLTENKGKYAITDEMLAQAHQMRESVQRHKEAFKLLQPGKKEVAFFWQCPFSNLPLKAKLDSAGSPLFVELKTTSDAGPEFFARHVHDMNYDLSLIHYQEGVKQVMGVAPPPYFVVVEQEAPFVCQVYKASDVMLEVGQAKWLSAVTKLADGMQKQKWPGYFSDEEIPELTPPPWAVNQFLTSDQSAMAANVEDDIF